MVRLKKRSWFGAFSDIEIKYCTTNKSRVMPAELSLTLYIYVLTSDLVGAVGSLTVVLVTVIFGDWFYLKV